MIERRIVGRQVTTLGTIPAPFRTATVGPPIITEGLVGHWDAGNPYSYPSTGTTWTDLTGKGNNGTLTNGPTYSADRSGGIVFDGTNDFVAHAASSDFYMSNTQAYTLEVWVMHPTISTTKIHGYLERWTTTDGFNLYMNPITSGTQLQWVTERRGSSTYAFARAVTARTTYENRWVHLCGTYDGTTLRVYLDSVLGVDTGTNTANLVDTTETLQIGRVDTSYMAGTMAIARIYNRVLSASEIFQNFQATRGRYNV